MKHLPSLIDKVDKLAYFYPRVSTLARAVHGLKAPHQAISNQSPLRYMIYTLVAFRRSVSERVSIYPPEGLEGLTLRALHVKQPLNVRSGESDCRLLPGRRIPLS
jgi:hypothetical protein